MRPFQPTTDRARRLPLLACLLALHSVVHAVTYYVAPSGDDARTTAQAQSISTPWKTIQKAATNMVAGDVCNIRAGTYRETVTPVNSGTSALAITFQAYGSEVVTIDGSELITGWTTSGGNIWNAPMSWTLADGNQVFLNSVVAPEARWPNPGSASSTTAYPWPDSSLPHPTNNELGDWSYANSTGYTSNANGWVKDAQLPPHPDGYWNGATLHIMAGYGWYMHFANVTGYTDADKKIVTDDGYGANPAYAFTTGNEFYLTGKKTEMDSPGEWFYDAPTTTLSIYSTASPTNVAAKKRNYGFNLSARSYITLLNLDFFACTVQTDATTANLTFDSLAMKYLGHSRKGPSVYGLALRNGCVLRNSDLGFDSTGLIQLAGNDIKLINNYLHDSGYVPVGTAMVDPPWGGSSAFYRTLISHNTLRDSGRSLIGFPGRASISEYNDLTKGMRLTTDGSMFNSNLEAGNAIARYNLIHDSSTPQGHAGAPVHGFYLDCESSSWIVHHNIIWNLPGSAMWMNARHNFNMVFNNTCWNAAQGSLGASFSMAEESGTHIYNNLFNAHLVGNTWSLSDVRYNLYTDPLFVSPSTGDFRLQSTSAAINAGTYIPGITDVTPSVSVGTADMGALEYTGTDWRSGVGYHTTPPSPDPTYVMPAMPFANQVKDGSFESGALAPNWTTITGSNVTLLTGNAWNDTRLRSGTKTLQFGVGTSEVKQTITGLLPNKRYKVYGAVQRTNATTVVKLGVRNYGYATLERVADVINRSTPLAAGEGSNIDASWWTVYNQSFVTGPSSTSAEIYLNVVIPAGVTQPVYSDDFCVELAKDPSADPVFAMPAFQLPFDETAGGTTAYDSTTHGRNGTISGGATWSAGIMGNALNFDGVNDSVNVPGNVPATSNGSFTVSTWVKFNALGAVTHYSTLASNNNGGWAVKGWQIKVAKDAAVNNFSIYFYMWSGTQTGSGGLAQAIVPNQWTHMAFVVDRPSGTITSYLNGVRSSVGTIPAGFTNVDTALGTMIGSPTFNGQLDDVRVYDYSLDDAQIAAIENTDPTQVMHLELDETAGATKAWDATGNGKNGTLTNMDPATVWSNGALSFDGVNDYVAAPKTVPITPTGSFTVAGWVKFNALGAITHYSTLLSNNNGGWAVKGWQIKVAKDAAVNNFSIYFYMWSGTQTGSGGLPTTIVPGQWAHVAFVVDRPNSKITGYLNGVANATGSIPAGFTDADTALGTMVGYNTFYGQLDDVRAYSRVLSWYEIQNLVFPNDGPPY